MKQLSILLLFLIVPFFLLAQKQGQALIDSLTREIDNVDKGKNKMPHRKIIAIADKIANTYYYELNDSVKAAEYYNKALKICDDFDDPESKADIILHFARFYVFKSNADYNKGLAYFNQCLQLKKKFEDAYGIGLVLNNIGGVYLSQGNYPVALENLLQSLKVAIPLNNKSLLSADYNDISVVYDKLADYPKALEALFSALKLLEEMHSADTCVVIGNIGSIYHHQGNDTKALQYHNKALAVMEKNGYDGPEMDNLNDIGDCYCSQRKYPLALSYCFRALAISEEQADKYWIMTNLETISKIYLKMAEDTQRTGLPDSLMHPDGDLYRRVVLFCLRGIELCKEERAIDHLQMFYLRISEAQEMLGDTKRAFENYKQYVVYHDSVFNNDNQKKLAQLQMKYDFDKKEVAEKAENDRKIFNIELTGVVSSSVLIILLIVFYFYRKQEKNKFNLQIAEVKREALNAQMSDHFIGNTMDSINGFIKNNDKEKASEYLVLFSRLIRKVLENATEKMIPLKDDLDILKNYLELEKLRFPAGHLQYEISIAGDIDVANTLIPPMVFQVLAENAIKHGFRKTTGGRLLLTVAKKNDSLECIVEDNGIGRRAAQAGKENANRERASYGGSLAEKLVKTGGRQTSYKITDLQDHSDNAAGTRVVFTLPYILAE